MEKKGQVALFVIVGVVIVIVALLLWYLNDSGIVPLTGSQDFLSSKLTPIEEDIMKCVTESVEPGVVLLGLQGGAMNPGYYAFYEGQRVKFLCSNIPNKERCLNHMPLLEDIRVEFEEYVVNALKNCMDPSLVKSGSGYDVSVGALDVNVEFGDEAVITAVDYDVKVIRDGETLELSKIEVPVDAPFKKLYGVVYDIVQAKATTGYFDQLIYMLQKRGSYEINVDKPYPHTIYKVNQKDSDYVFLFAVEGEGGYVQ